MGVFGNPIFTSVESEPGDFLLELVPNHLILEVRSRVLVARLRKSHIFGDGYSR